jgi:hypothetical protein
MADSADNDSKTEEATEKKIRDAVEKGQLPHSKEAPILASFAAILVFAVFFAKESMVDLSGFLATFLEKPEAWPIETEFDTVNLMRVVFFEIGKALAAILILLVVAGVGASVLQHAPSVVFDRIAPKASRISIGEGWKRLFGAQGLAEFAKSVGKLVLALAFLIFAVREAQHRLLLGMITQPGTFALVIRQIAIDILLALTFAMAVVAAAEPAHDQAGSEGRAQAERRRSDHQGTHALTRPRPRPPAHDGGGAEGDAGHRQSDALFDRAQICARGGCRAGRARQGPGPRRAAHQGDRDRERDSRVRGRRARPLHVQTSFG